MVRIVWLLRYFMVGVCDRLMGMSRGKFLVRQLYRCPFVSYNASSGCGNEWDYDTKFY